MSCGEYPGIHVVSFGQCTRKLPVLRIKEPSQTKDGILLDKIRVSLTLYKLLKLVKIAVWVPPVRKRYT